VTVINDCRYEFQPVADCKLPQPPLMYFMSFTTLNQEGIQEKPFNTIEELIDYVTTKLPTDSFDYSRAFYYGRRVPITTSRVLRIGVDGRTINVQEELGPKQQQKQ
jgi:hypothetical protein